MTYDPQGILIVYKKAAGFFIWNTTNSDYYKAHILNLHVDAHKVEVT